MYMNHYSFNVYKSFCNWAIEQDKKMRPFQIPVKIWISIFMKSVDICPSLNSYKILNL